MALAKREQHICNLDQQIMKKTQIHFEKNNNNKNTKHDQSYTTQQLANPRKFINLSDLAASCIYKMTNVLSPKGYRLQTLPYVRSNFTYTCTIHKIMIRL